MEKPSPELFWFENNSKLFEFWHKLCLRPSLPWDLSATWTHNIWVYLLCLSWFELDFLSLVAERVLRHRGSEFGFWLWYLFLSSFLFWHNFKLTEKLQELQQYKEFSFVSTWTHPVNITPHVQRHLFSAGPAPPSRKHKMLEPTLPRRRSKSTDFLTGRNRLMTFKLVNEGRERRIAPPSSGSQLLSVRVLSWEAQNVVWAEEAGDAHPQQPEPEPEPELPRMARQKPNVTGSGCTYTQTPTWSDGAAGFHPSWHTQGAKQQDHLEGPHLWGPKGHGVGTR